MKARLFMSMAAAALVWTGCSNDENGSGADARVPVEFRASVGVTETRAIDQTWSLEDVIGIFMVESDKPLQDANISEGAKNIRYKVAAANSKEFSPDGTPIYFPMDNSEVDFYAYYPQGLVRNDPNSGNYLYDINVSDQGDETKSNQENLDLMYADKVEGKRKTDKNISLNFRHQLCKVILTVEPGEGVTTLDMNALTVEVNNQNTTATFDLTTGMLLMEDAADPKDIVLYRRQSTYIYEAILLPDDGTSRTFEFDLNNEHDAPFIWNMEKALVAGRKYTYTVKLDRTGVEVEGNIEAWTPENGGEVNAN